MSDIVQAAHDLHHKAYLISGVACFLGGIALLAFFYRNLYFNLTPDVNVAGHVLLLMVSFGVIWLGMWLAAWGFGVFTHA